MTHEAHGMPVGLRLSDDDLTHFGRHGWVVVEDVVPSGLRDRLRDDLGRLLAGLSPWDTVNGLQGCSEPHLRSPTFLELLAIRGLIDAARQLIGHSPRLRHCTALRTRQHPAADADHDRVSDMSNWDWHRDFSPLAIIRSEVSQLVTSQAVVVAAYLTATSPEAGATAFLDGSHLAEGDFDSLQGSYPMVQPSVPAGGVAFFSEALMHAGPPVLGPHARDVVLSWMTAPWFGGEAPPPFDVGRWTDEPLKRLFRPPFFGDRPQ